MTDYIKREDALDIVADNNVTGEITLKRYDKIIDGIYEIPSADVTPVVRCKDCKFAHMTYGGECKYCDAWESEESLYLDGDFFCAFGERKDDE